MFLWADALKDFVDRASPTEVNHHEHTGKLRLFSEKRRISPSADGVDPKEIEASAVSSATVPPIYSDESFEDRKSVFQAHLSPVHSKEEVQLVLQKLRENKKIANATHNMYAYR